MNNEWNKSVYNGYSKRLTRRKKNAIQGRRGYENEAATEVRERMTV